MRRFGGQSVSGLMDRLGLDEDVPIEHGLVSKAIESAQMRVEGHNFDIRKHVLEYDDVVNKQREVIYNQRRQILSEPTLKPTIIGMVVDEIKELVELFAGGDDRQDWDLTGLAVELNKIIFPPHGENPESWRNFTAPQLVAHLIERAEKAYEDKEAAMGGEMLRHLERLVMLRAVDNRWVRHLTDLDELREGIGLRAFGQQDPLVAYKREAHEMYQELVGSIAHDVAYAIYHAQMISRPAMPQRMQTNRGDGGAPQPVRSAKTPGRNDPCWCGSGEKYKHCHGRAGRAARPCRRRRRCARGGCTSRGGCTTCGACRRATAPHARRGGQTSDRPSRNRDASKHVLHPATTEQPMPRIRCNQGPCPLAARGGPGDLVRRGARFALHLRCRRQQPGQVSLAPLTDGSRDAGSLPRR